MSFADRVAVAPERPACWGSKDSFDPDDSDCQECRFQHSCRQEVSSKRIMTHVPASYPRPSTSSYRPNTSAEYTNWSPGPMHAEDNAFHRFLKDGAAGGLRGMFYEFYRFWTVFRFK